MLKLSYKAIARMAGYRVEYTNGYFDRYDYIPGCFKWVDDGTVIDSYDKYTTEEEAYKACCIDNGLVGDEDE
jgi:hypothetical protein